MGLFNRKKKDKNKAPTDELSQKIMQDAQACIDNFGGRFPGMDYSVESLSVLDEMLEELSDFYPEFDVDRQQSIQSLTGSYVFEVARRKYGGQYFWYEQGEQPILVTGQPKFEISLLAFAKVEGRILNGSEDNIPFFFQGYADRVENARPGDKAMVV